MKRQKGLSLISTLIIGMLLMSVLILGLKVVPVYTEYYSVKHAFGEVLNSTDSDSPPANFRRAFARYKDVGDFSSIDVNAVTVSKSAGVVTLEVVYRKEVPLYSNVGLYFDFDIVVEK